MTPTERRKLVGVLGMLGSDHDGERATAARMATEMLKKAGATWGELLAPDAPPPLSIRGDDFRALALALLQRGVMLDEAETRFLRSILAWRKISAKQQEWLNRIALKVRVAEGAA